MTPQELRARLPSTWGALYERHGRPRPIQLAAAGPLLEGRDVLLCAPTASGKTEAYLAPLLERHGVRGAAEPRLLVVSPTRALANDLHRRLSERLGSAGFDVGRWTGEHHDAGRLHPLTILTPEALDARLARSPAALTRVAALVLDELHVLDGGVRGDHLRILVERLRVERPGPLQVAAASATVPDAAGMAARYLRDAEVVQAGDRRRIRARIEIDAGPDGLRALLTEQVAAGFRKVLCFTNARSDVEILAAQLRGGPPFGDQVFAHHGSIAKDRRLQTESAFLRAPAALCVATSTLEIGIDIGDVDLVLLHGVPPDIPALLQRVGRGGRRTAENVVLAVVPGAFQAVALRSMLQAAARGEWLAGPVGFRSGVLLQQALSTLHARPSRTIDAGAVARRLPPDLRAAWPTARVHGLLTAAASHGWLGPEAPDGRFPLGPKGEAAWARGELHGNLQTTTEVEIRDTTTGEAVGSVAVLDGPEVTLGGKTRALVHADGKRRVTRETRELGALPNFAARPGPAISRAQATAWLRAAGIPAPCRSTVRGAEICFHGLGTALAPVLAFLLKKSGFRLDWVGRLAIVARAPWPDTWPTASGVASALGHKHRGLARALGMGPFHAVLPEREQVSAVASLVELDALEALTRQGPPPTVPCADEALWTEAAWG